MVPINLQKNMYSTSLGKLSNCLFSDREREVLLLLSYGDSSKIIVQLLKISIDTVNVHRKNLLSRIEAKNSASLIARSYEKGVLILNGQPEISQN